jgi:putative transcriptional regulator
VAEYWKCMECGAEMTQSLKDHRYLENGLRVLLVDIPHYECTQCDYSEYEIAKPEQLNKVLRAAIAEKVERLTGPEVRFLRKSMGWSGNDLAEWMSVARETVSRWETSKREMTPTAERLLRLYALTKEPIQAYGSDGLNMDGLKCSGTEPASPKLIRILREGVSWRAAM